MNVIAYKRSAIVGLSVDVERGQCSIQAPDKWPVLLLGVLGVDVAQLLSLIRS